MKFKKMDLEGIDFRNMEFVHLEYNVWGKDWRLYDKNLMILRIDLERVKLG